MKQQQGTSFLELMVVVAIVGILGVMLSQYLTSRNKQETVVNQKKEVHRRFKDFESVLKRDFSRMERDPDKAKLRYFDINGKACLPDTESCHGMSFYTKRPQGADKPSGRVVIRSACEKSKYKTVSYIGPKEDCLSCPKGEQSSLVIRRFGKKQVYRFDKSAGMGVCMTSDGDSVDIKFVAIMPTIDDRFRTYIRHLVLSSQGNASKLQLVE